MSFYGAFFRTLFWRPRRATQALYWHAKGQALRARSLLRAGAAPPPQTGAPQSPHAYQVWIDTVERREKTIAQAPKAIEEWATRPRLTVLLYQEQGAAPGAFERCVTALSRQIYPHWELVLVQSHEVQPPLAIAVPRLVLAPSRASNAAAALSIGMHSASGSHILPLAVGTRLAPTALYHFAEALQDHPQADVFYGDHDHTGLMGLRRRPWLKPEWNRAMFLSQDYLSPVCLLRAEHLTAALPLPPALAEAAIYAVLLGVTARAEASVVHVPHILAQIGKEDERDTEDRPETPEDNPEPDLAPAFDGAVFNGTTAGSIEDLPVAPAAPPLEQAEIPLSTAPEQPAPVGRHAARLAALARALEHEGATITPGPWGTHRIDWPLPEDPGPVSILIPAGQKAEPLRRCVLSLLGATRYARRHVVIASHGMPGADMERYLGRIAQNPRVTVLRMADAPSSAALLNRAARAAQGRFLCLMSPQVEVLDDLWLTALLRHAIRAETGAAGARLLNRNGTIHHAGLVVGLGEGAGHAHRYQRDTDPGYFAQAHITRHVTAVSSACLLIDREKFEAAGGLDEDAFAHAFHDVDLCLKLEQAGLRNIYVPEALLLHHDMPVSRRPARHGDELAMLRERWGTDTFRDPLHHRYLDRKSERYTLSL
ncbi:glycosyltransferase [Novosphingobium terrae]|uniref:glycosyltransferase n=1 Tax=Novosphingobium terrae TaxID=2726189 RepID=UPI00197EABCA|nr:glycosyltransferase [Novosphingobium terrae]